MRVLALYHAYPPKHGAGAEWDAHTLLRALVEAGHHVDVQLSTSEKVTADYELGGVNVHAHRDKHDPFRWLNEADVIVTHLENTPRATILGEQSRIPVIHRLHNTFDATKRWLKAPGATLGVANSEWMAEEHRKESRAPVIVVRPYVRTEDYVTKPGRKVTLVNLFENKGGAQFWRIAEAMPDVEFLAVRGGYGEQVMPDVIPDNVTVIDNTANMRDDVYAQTKILLMPSEYESWGRVGIEAMASGIPVVAHPTAGLTESLGSAGTFVNRDEIEGWVKAIRSLRSPKNYAAASRSAKARVEELSAHPDLQTWVAAVENVVKVNPRRR
jgi:glycosyltransferase involved in cell wall biosynthesis